MQVESENTCADDWLTPIELAQEFPHLLTATYLERCRTKNGPPGPPYFKRGPRGRVFYRRSEVEKWLQDQMKKESDNE